MTKQEKPKKTVHLISMCIQAPPEIFEDGAEVWGVNRAYQKQEGLTRTFFFDNPHLFQNPPILDDLKDIGHQIWTRKPYPEIANNHVYPREEVVNFFGLQYFVCTVAWMMGLAIYEEFERIYLHGMYMTHHSIEYMHHIPCVNFWAGIALGKGIELRVGKESNVTRPFPWQPNLYGYIGQMNEALSTKTVAAAYEACLAYPLLWLDMDEMERQQLSEIARDRQRAYDVISEEKLRMVAKAYRMDESLDVKGIKKELNRVNWCPTVPEVGLEYAKHSTGGMEQIEKYAPEVVRTQERPDDRSG